MLCRLVFWIFAGLYAIALALFAIGSFGLFGQQPGPLAGIFVIPLGVPWVFLVDLAPEPLWPWLAGLAPAINLGLIWLLCRRSKRR